MSVESFVIAGDVRTMSAAGLARARTVEVVGDRIRAVAERRDTNGMRRYDFGDRVVLPGFVDPHTHAEVAAATNAMVDCRAPMHATVTDVLDELRDNLDSARDGWLVAQANLFFDQKLKEGRYPNLTELDAVTDQVAIVIQAGGHVSILNSKAMELAEIGRFHTGGSGVSGAAVVELGEDGRPTGVVSEIDGFLPIPQPTTAEFTQLIERGLEELYTSVGVTTIGEITHSIDSTRSLAGVVSARRTMRVDAYLWVPHTMSLDEACTWPNALQTTSVPEHFAVKGVKMFCDGGYSAHNAATLTPYMPEFAVEPNSRGQLAMEHDYIAKVLEQLSDTDLQLVVHSNGERAQQELSAGVVQARENGYEQTRPVRSEHAGNLVTSERTTAAWREGGLVPVSQPVFLYNFGAFIPRLLGPAADRGQFGFRNLLDDGWHVCGSSDYLLGSEVGQSNPLFGVWCCVTRHNFFGDVMEPDQCVTVDEALRMHTLYAAEAMGVADTRGSLEPGKYADMVVLDRDPYTVEAERLPEIRVDYVFVGGEIVYSRPDAAPYATATS